MSLIEQKAKFHTLDDWFLTPQGLNVAQAFLAELTPIQDLFHGETLLQLGSCGENSLYSKFRYPHKWIGAPYLSAKTALITQLNRLPLDRDSVNCVIAPLTLEAFINKETLIDEIDRVLKPLGYVIFFGVNPFSLWGLWLRIANNTCFGNIQTKPKSVLSIKRAMTHRGYVQCHLSTFYYIPPIINKHWIEKFEILNEVGKMISPMPSGFYCFVVQKQQENLIPLIKLSTNKNYLVSAVPPLQPTCRK